MDKLWNDDAYKDGDFVLNWMLFNWNSLNFIEYSILKAFKIYQTRIQELIKVAFLYSNEHFVKEL